MLVLLLSTRRGVFPNSLLLTRKKVASVLFFFSSKNIAVDGLPVLAYFLIDKKLKNPVNILKNTFFLLSILFEIFVSFKLLF